GVKRNCHALPAAATQNQPLQQRGSFSSRALTAVASHRLCTFVQPPLIFLIVLPGEITDVGSRNQRVPLLFRQVDNMQATVHSFSRVTSALNANPPQPPPFPPTP